MNKQNGDALKTDFYELTMAAAYFQNKVNARATFELYCHTLPLSRSFLVACGLAQVLEYIKGLRFAKEDIAFLKNHPTLAHLPSEFFDYLRNFRFTGDIWAMPEGEICFANEPLLQVTAPIIEAQLLETYLLSVLNIETLVATKASRVVQAACCDGKARAVVDFGSRRAHGPEAALLAARASYVGGCVGTSNVRAGQIFEIPLMGTMAHSWVQAFEREEEAYRRYQAVFPEQTTFLVDTYDTIDGVKKAVALGQDFRGVRIDSGNLLALSRRTRKILDQNNLAAVKIVASGNLNELKILKLVEAGAPIDVFGVGTDMVVPADAPVLDLTYKLVETQDEQGVVQYKLKLSQGKQTVPGRKQVYRQLDRGGRLKSDMICLSTEKPPRASSPLLIPVMTEGREVQSTKTLNEIRRFAQRRKQILPSNFWDFQKQTPSPVKFSPALRKLIP